MLLSVLRAAEIGRYQATPKMRESKSGSRYSYTIMTAAFRSLEGAILVVTLGGNDSNSSLVRNRYCSKGRRLNSSVTVLCLYEN